MVDSFTSGEDKKVMSSSKVRAIAMCIALSATSVIHAQHAVPAGAPPSAPGATPRMTEQQMTAAQQAAIAKLSAFDGVWRGSGSMRFSPNEAPHEYTQVVRVGSLDDGMIKVFDIYSYLANGKLDNRQLNMVSFNPQKGEYVVLARGGPYSDTFGFRVTDDGYAWTIGAGPGGIQFTGTLKDGIWTQVAVSQPPGQPSVQMAQWTLRRAGDTDWPEGKTPKP